MSDETRPDSVPTDSDAWISDFLQQLELEFLQLAKFTFSRTSDTGDNQRALLFAIRRLLANDGMPEAVMQSIFSDPKFGWTEAKNKRRFELIDREVDDTLSHDEALELESLTFQMRYASKPVEDDRVNEARQELERLKIELGQSEKKPS